MNGYGLTRDRVVAVIVDLSDGLQQVGSGYLVADGRVLTAEHATRNKDRTSPEVATGVRVVRASDGATATVAGDPVADADLDVAVLTLADTPWDPGLVAVQAWRVDRNAPGILADCVVIGFPEFMHDPATELHGTAELHGDIYQTDEAETGRLLMREPRLHVGSDPDTVEHWAGLSGALVFYRGRALGVVVEHHPRQGDNSVRLVGFDSIAASDGLRAALSLPGAQDLPWAAAGEESGPRVVATSFTRTPMTGLQFRQGGQVCPMQHVDTRNGLAVRVLLRPEAFEVWFPSLPKEDPELRLCAWSDDAVFDLRAGEPVDSNPHFGGARGMAQYQYGDGSLILNLEGFNYFLGSRIEPTDAGGYSKVFISRAWSVTGALDVTLSEQAVPDLFLVVLRDDDGDGIIDAGEFEYIRLEFG